MKHAQPIEQVITCMHARGIVVTNLAEHRPTSDTAIKKETSTSKLSCFIASAYIWVAVPGRCIPHSNE